MSKKTVNISTILVSYFSELHLYRKIYLIWTLANPLFQLYFTNIGHSNWRLNGFGLELIKT